MIITTQALKTNHSEHNNLIKNTHNLFLIIKLKDISNYKSWKQKIIILLFNI